MRPDWWLGDGPDKVSRALGWVIGALALVTLGAQLVLHIERIPELRQKAAQRDAVMARYEALRQDVVRAREACVPCADVRRISR